MSAATYLIIAAILAAGALVSRYFAYKKRIKLLLYATAACFSFAAILAIYGGAMMLMGM